MRVLAVVYANRVPNNDLLYESLAEHVELQKLEVDRKQAQHLAKVLADHELLDYDRVVIEIRAKHAISQWRYLWTVPNLVLYEEDTWQDFASFSKNFGFFGKYYDKAQPCRIIHSGYTVADKTSQAGHDSHFLPKGYDSAKLSNIGLPRDIELGFVGRLEHSNYVHRKTLLQKLATLEPLQILRTESDQEYLQTLNRIRFFISADVEFGEHMIKNFEAMACGCVLFAYRQGEDDDALGLQDMDNVVLYSSLDELTEKLNRLRDNEPLTTQIAANGQRLAKANHDHRLLGRRYFDILSKPLGRAREKTLVRKGRLADKKMSLSFFERHETHNLDFKFFPAHRFIGPDERWDYLERVFKSATEGAATPNVRFWGQQKEQRLSWVALDPID